MKENRIKSAIIVISVVTLLLISSIPIGLSAESNSVAVDNINSSGKLSKKISDKPIKIVKCSLETLNNLGFSDFDDGNILVSSTTDDEFSPAIVVSGMKAIAAYEIQEDSKNSILFQLSKDNGVTWGEPYAMQGVIGNISDISLTIGENKNKAYGMFLSDVENSTLVYEVEFGNIDDPSTWTASTTADPWANNDFYDFKNSDIAFYDDEISYNVKYIGAFIGSTDYADDDGDASCVNTPIFFYRAGDSFTVAWDPNINNCSNISIDRTEVNNKTYGICEQKNGSNTDLFFFDDDPIGYAGNWVKGGGTISHQIITEPGNLTHPRISVDNTNLSIVAETDARGVPELVLIHSKDLGKTWESPVYIQTNHHPIPDFSYSTNRLQVAFVSKAIDSDGSIVSHFWEFGDESNSTLVNPVHTYSATGSYTVSLTVEDNQGSVYTYEEIVNVSSTDPVADFTYLPTVINITDDITFNSTSTAHPGYNIVNWTWDFGDGYTAFTKDVVHNYTDYGAYKVKLTVTDNNSESSFIVKTVNVGIAADFMYTPSNPTVGQTIVFNDTSYNNSDIELYNGDYDFGDGQNSAGPHTTHIYSKPGVYTVIYKINHSDDISDTITKEITVKPNDFYPRYPDVYLSNPKITILFTRAENLYSIQTNDYGENWTLSTLYNNELYSVVPNYKFADIEEEDYVIWTDDRNIDYDIFFATSIVHEVDLVLLTDSFELLTMVDLKLNVKPFITTKNWFNFTVRNNGTKPVTDIPINIEIPRDNKSNYIPAYQPFINYLSPGKEEVFTVPIFRLDPIEFINALMDLAGITAINITIDTESSFDDANLENNKGSFTVVYKDIFPKLYWLERLFTFSLG